MTDTVTLTLTASEARALLILANRGHAAITSAGKSAEEIGGRSDQHAARQALAKLGAAAPKAAKVRRGAPSKTAAKRDAVLADRDRLTVREIARKHGIGIGSVSRILNAKP